MSILKENLGKLAVWMAQKSGITFESMNQHFERVRGGGVSAMNFKNSSDYLNAYELASYLGNLISIVANDISRLEVEVTDSKGKQIKDKRIEDFFSEPAQGLTLYELCQLSILHYILDGNIFWLVRQPTLAEVRNGRFFMYPLIPSLVDVYSISGLFITPGTQTNSMGIGGYRVTSDDGTYEVDTNSIIHTKMIGPKNYLRGMGKVQQNISVLDADRITTIFNNLFFANGASPSAIIQPEKDLSPVTFKQFSTQMRDMYEGQRNIGKMMIMPLAGKVTPGNLSQRDMQFIEQQRFTKENMREVVQVPSIMLTGSDTKYDSSDAQIAAYYKFTLPRYAKGYESALENVFRRFILKRPDIFVSIKFPKHYEIKAAPELFDRGAITGNDYREMLGLSRDESVATLNMYFMKLQLMPISGIVDPKSEEQQQNPKKSIKWTNDQQILIHNRAKSIKERTGKIIEKGVKQFYSGLESRVLAKYKDTGELSTKSFDDPFDLNEEIKRAEKDSVPFFTSAVTISLNDISEMFDITIDSSTKNRDVRLVVESLGKTYATETMNSRYDEIKKIISTTMEENKPHSEIAIKLKEYFSELRGENAWKATRIARTEAFYCWDQAAMLSYKELGVNTLDVVGCLDDHGNCNRRGIPIAEGSSLRFHPNHTGSIVPAR